MASHHAQAQRAEELRVKQSGRWIGGLAAIVFALVGAATAAGYAGEVAGSVEITVGSIKCNQPITVTATVLDNNGKVISGQSVVWAFTSTPSTADTISPSSSTTDINGVATTVVTLACIPGNRQLRATADQVNGMAVLGLVVGLPNTTTAPPSVPPEPGLLPVLLAILVVLVGAGVTARRLVPARR